MYNYINDLSSDKQNLINKYSLVLNDDLIWEFNHPKYFNVKYFSHKFAIKHSTLTLLFHIYKLCYAKIKYFESNFSKYDPYIYNYNLGFIKCELYDMEFIKHKYSDTFIDLRYLNKIKDIKEFKSFCAYLENFEPKL